jgi:hypothetical protein
MEIKILTTAGKREYKIILKTLKKAIKCMKKVAKQIRLLKPSSRYKSK